MSTIVETHSTRVPTGTAALLRAGYGRSMDPVDARKLALRDQLVTGRGRRSLLEVAEAARAIAEHLMAAPEVRRAATVAAYVSVGTEPGTGPLLNALVASGRRVILPLLQPDND